MDYYQEFLVYLEKEDKIGAVNYAINLLKQNKVDIVSLYINILAPSLNNMFCNSNEKDICVWKEHVRSSIIRTIIECCFPYIIEERGKRNIKINGEKVVVVCPQEEYHEIGARMIADFYTLLGFDTVFVGANTPKEDFVSAINTIKPKYVVISVTNSYNLVNAEKTINKIRETANYDLKIIVGGNAFKLNKDAHKKIGADAYLESFDDIKAFVGGDVHETTL